MQIYLMTFNDEIYVNGYRSISHKSKMDKSERYERTMSHFFKNILILFTF